MQGQLLRLALRNRELEALLAEHRGGGEAADPQLEEVLAERDALVAAPAKKMSFNRAHVGQVLQFLAQEAGVPFVFTEHVNDDRRLITFDWEKSPFEALESVALTNGYQLAKEGDDWTVLPLNPGGVGGTLSFHDFHEKTHGRPVTDEEARKYREYGMDQELRRLIDEYVSDRGGLAIAAP